jgi:hypothetical protein
MTESGNANAGSPAPDASAENVVENSGIRPLVRWALLALCTCFVFSQYGNINTQANYDLSVVAVATLSVALFAGFTYLVQRRRRLQIDTGTSPIAGAPEQNNPPTRNVITVYAGALLGSLLISYYAVGLAASFIPGSRQSFCAHVDTSTPRPPHEARVGAALASHMASINAPTCALSGIAGCHRPPHSGRAAFQWANRS